MDTYGQSTFSGRENEEIAKFQFRKAANAALSGETEAQADQQEVPVAKPPIIKRPQRKRVEGGC